MLVGARAALVAASALALQCGSPATGPRDEPRRSPDPGDEGVLLYVTFSGESDKKGVTQPVDNVYGIRADGSWESTRDLLDSSAVDLDELRGMALSPEGTRLFVANANKKHNQILVFGPLADTPGGTKFVGIFAGPGTPDATGLLHPYQPVFDDEGNLYVSSQDTYVVTSFSSSGGDAPTGSVRATASWWTESYGADDLYPGTWAPADETSRADTPPPIPTRISSSDGGLKGPRGIAASSARRRLYVADNADQSVKGYDLATGEYLGKVIEFGKGRPVGLALDDDAGHLFVTAEDSDDVHVVDLGDPSDPCDSSCPATKIIESQEGEAELDAPSGIVVFADPSAETAILYVASRHGLRINRYVYDFAASTLASSQTFATGFTDTPEQLVAAP